MKKQLVAETKKPYSVMIRPSIAEEYGKLSGEMYMTRSQLMANALEIALDDIHMLKALGVVRAVGGVRKAQMIIEEWRKTRAEIALRMI